MFQSHTTKELCAILAINAVVAISQLSAVLKKTAIVAVVGDKALVTQLTCVRVVAIKAVHAERLIIGSGTNIHVCAVFQPSAIETIVRIKAVPDVTAEFNMFITAAIECWVWDASN